MLSFSLQHRSILTHRNLIVKYGRPRPEDKEFYSSVSSILQVSHASMESESADMLHVYLESSDIARYSFLGICYRINAIEVSSLPRPHKRSLFRAPLPFAGSGHRWSSIPFSCTQHP